jgi:exodeoxyribonuclease VIII
MHRSRHAGRALPRRRLDPERPPAAASTAAQLFGTLAHSFVLEPDKAHRYVCKPEGHDGRTKDGKAWLAANAGSICVGADDWQAATEARRAVLAVPELRHALSSGAPEVSVFWTDERTGLQCRARIDWLHTLPDGRAIVLDLKTCPDAGPLEFGRSVWAYGYHRQAAHYTHGLQANGIEVAAFLFAAVSNAHPFIAVPYLLDDDATRRGADEVRELLDLYNECQRTNTWPAYGDGVQVLSLPAWAK